MFHEYPKAIGDQLALTADDEARLLASVADPEPEKPKRGRKPKEQPDAGE